MTWTVSIHPQVVKFIDKHLSAEDTVRVLDLFDRLETYGTEVSMELKEYHQQLMQDPEVAAARRRLQPKLDLGRQILDLRLARGWTQEDLAERVGTKQANISRLENGLLNPSVDMLQRVAGALGAALTVTLEPVGQPGPAFQ
jgi:ribosome-binding protein aMBF1 (putative translation factor)